MTTIGHGAIAAACRRLAPLLKSEGFRKRQSTFWKTCGTHSFQFALHGAWFDTKDRATIDIPIGLVWHEADKAVKNAVSRMPRPYWKCTGYSKLRSGRPSRQIAWRIDSKTDPVKLAVDIEAVAREDVMPWFAFGAAIAGVLEGERKHSLERRKFFLSLLMHSGYTCDGFGADSLQRAGCSLTLLRRLARAVEKSGHEIRCMDRVKPKRRDGRGMGVIS